MVHLVTNRQKSDILNYLEIFLKNKAPDCIIYSEDGVGGVICGIYFPMFKRRTWPYYEGKIQCKRKKKKSNSKSEQNSWISIQRTVQHFGKCQTNCIG